MSLIGQTKEEITPCLRPVNVAKPGLVVLLFTKMHGEGVWQYAVLTITEAA